MKPIIDFIKYHNAVSIGFALFILASGAMAASPDARGVLYNTETTPKSSDNSFLLNVELDRSDFNLVILDIQEDEENYYIEYEYDTVKVREYSWQPVSLRDSLIIAKSALGRQDLGELVARELGQLIDREYIYFKDAQKIERAKGPSKKVVTTKYAGLIGALLDSKDKVFPGYEPVVAEGDHRGNTPNNTLNDAETDGFSVTSAPSPSEAGGEGGSNSALAPYPSVASGSGSFSDTQGDTPQGIIYPQVSADYDDYLKNVAPNGESAQAPDGDLESRIWNLESSTTTTDTATSSINENQPESALISVEATSSEPAVTENSTSTEVTFQHGATE